MKKVFLLTHLGQGDSIICNGMIRTIASKVEELLLVAKKPYKQAMVSMFGDLPNVSVEYVDDAPDVSPAFNGGIAPPLFQDIIGRGFTFIPLGLHTGNPNWQVNEPNFAKAFYNQVGLDYQCSWINFRFRMDVDKHLAMYNKVVKFYGYDYSFIHDDPKRKILIPRQPGVSYVHPDDSLIYSTNIFDYYLVIRNAKQLHFFDSCFGLLMDRMHTDGAKFCYTTGIRPVVPGFYRDTSITYI